MKRAFLLGMTAVLLAACSASQPRASVRPSISPASVTSPASAGRVAVQPSPTPAPHSSGLLFAVETSSTRLGSILYGPSSGCYDRLVACAPPDTIEILDVNGQPVQKYGFTPIKSPWTNCESPLLGPQAYVVGGRVFFIDGLGIVRSLAQDGTTETIASFPYGDQREISFAVRPDGQEVVAAVLTLPPPPATGPDCSGGPPSWRFGQGNWVMDIYIAAIGGSSQLISHREVPQGDGDSAVAVQLVGWTAIGPMATNPTQISGGCSCVERWFGPLVSLDPTTGAITPFAKPFASDFLVDGSYVTADRDLITVFAPNGSTEWSYSKAHGVYGSALLAPNSEHAVADGPFLNQPELVGRDSTDAAVGTTSERFEALGWVDQSTMIGWLRGVEELGLVRTNLPTQITDLGLAATYVGVLASTA